MDVGGNFQVVKDASATDVKSPLLRAGGLPRIVVLGLQLVATLNLHCLGLLGERGRCC